MPIYNQQFIFSFVFSFFIKLCHLGNLFSIILSSYAVPDIPHSRVLDRMSMTPPNLFLLDELLRFSFPVSEDTTLLFLTMHFLYPAFSQVIFYKQPMQPNLIRIFDRIVSDTSNHSVIIINCQPIHISDL